jgi:hypothetical protein
MSKNTKFHDIVDDGAGDAGAQDEIGYCKPPKQHQFKPGQSGNPKGRNTAAAHREGSFPLHRVLMEEIEVKVGDKKATMTFLEAILKKQVAKALAGDNKSAQILLNQSGNVTEFWKEWKRQTDEAVVKAVREAVNNWKF